MLITAEILFVLPELALLGLACLTLVCDVFSNNPNRRVTYWLAQVSLLGVAGLALYLYPVGTVAVFHQHYILDPLSVALKVTVCVASLLVFAYSYHYFRQRDLLQGEYFVLGLFAVLGMLVMISAHSLLTVYLGLELMSLALYAMVAMNRESGTAAEAAMKYFVLGALASGLLLYGISIVYGVSGTLVLPELAAYLEAETDNRIMFLFGLVFIIVGIAFKLGAAPFHSWVPDVYEGSPTAVTLFLATAPKVAAFAMAIRLLIDGMLPMHIDWQGMLVILALLSMAVGNIIAIVQTNIKRMLAYSAIAHAGFLILGILPGLYVEQGASYAGALFYVIAYVIMSMGAFGFIILAGGKDHEADRLDNLKGLADASPWFALVMLLFMFSLAGVPPFLGFWAKWYVLKEVVAIGYIWLAVLAVVFSVIGAYYYLRIIKLMYFEQVETAPRLSADTGLRVLVSLNGLAVLALGFAPGGLMEICSRVVGL
ncbi:MAG: NADH-quinone oxidoreductase subunit NuoN [Gammaproteobacteria bacterium]|nr:NADH-quinone oxidoreductase subunit NuoN [Gammaproteobacteria bacterium]